VCADGGKANVSVWWWVAIGLGAWFLVSVAVALFVGPVLRRCREAAEAIGRRLAKSDDHREQADDERRVS
jgi:hypothetical protein